MQSTKPVGVAVSGGGDSIGLLHILAQAAGDQRHLLRVATVDHGLRDASRSEAEFVAQTCAELGIEHDILTWGDAPSGNLQAAARAARYDLLADWATAHGLSSVLLGHTQDDRAETFLMRLARGSGVDGLAAMGRRRRWKDVEFLRPMLDTSRASIRSYLSAQGLSWIDDPSNDDDAFDRVKARKALLALEPLGLTADRLIDTAHRMGLASTALMQVAVDVANRSVNATSGDVVVDLEPFAQAPHETQLRLLAAGLCWVSGNPYRPRFSSVSALLDAHYAGRAQTLHGCFVTGDRDSMRIAREYNAIKDTACASDQIWDGRWIVDGPHTGALTIRTLGESIKDVPDWRDLELPRASLMASPAVFDGKTLISAPIAGLQNGFSARIVADFMSFLLSR